LRRVNVQRWVLLGDPRRYLGTRAEPEFVADLLDVEFGRAFGDHERRGDLAVGEASSHERRGFALAWG
jgi:hypothetical protein